LFKHKICSNLKFVHILNFFEFEFCLQIYLKYEFLEMESASKSQGNETEIAFEKKRHVTRSRKTARRKKK
jgi:hypothetical protein